MTPHDKHDKEAVERERFEHAYTSIPCKGSGRTGWLKDFAWRIWLSALSAPAPVAEQPKRRPLSMCESVEEWKAQGAEPVAAPAQAMEIAYESILAEAERRKSHYGQTVGYESDRDKEHCIGFWVHQVMSEYRAIEARKEQG